MRRGIFFVLTFIVTAGFASVSVGQDRIDRELERKAAISLRQQVGKLRGTYFYKGLVVHQIGDGWAIPDPTIRLKDGNYLMSGCRRHYCPEKSAIIVRPNGTVVAAGLINFRCAYDPHPRKDCVYRPRMTIFVQAANDDPDKLKPLYDWAKAFPPTRSKDRVTIFEKVILPKRP